MAVTLSLIASENKVKIPEVTPPITINVEGKEVVEEESAEPIVPQATDTDNGSMVNPPPRTYFLLVGIDENNLTDTLITGCFYRDSVEIRLMSIPRDLYTLIPDERLARMREDGLNPPNVMKINALRSYGRQYGTVYLCEQLGEMLGVSFNYYAEVELSAFKKLVNIIGGVWMDIPSYLQYEDPEQGLSIKIAPGMQLFDGQKAEELIRYRSYPSGDLGRNAVQMEFLKQLIRQTLTREAIMSDPKSIIDLVLNDTRHNVGLDVVKYLPFITEVKGENINTYTMPGDGRYINGSSFFIPDDNLLPETIHEVFFADGKEENESIEPRLSHGLNIQVLNGSRVAGLGSAFADMLIRDGYTVADTDAFTGTKENTTRINIRTEGTGDDLQHYFKNSVIKLDANMPAEYDIVIIVGRGEQ